MSGTDVSSTSSSTASTGGMSKKRHGTGARIGVPHSVIQYPAVTDEKSRNEENVLEVIKKCKLPQVCEVKTFTCTKQHNTQTHRHRHTDTDTCIHTVFHLVFVFAYNLQINLS